MYKRDAMSDILKKTDIKPVLFDVGAAGGTPHIWKKIAKRSVYVGFDPDAREIKEISDGAFYKSIIINKAVSAEVKQKTSFYLTKYPYCSSTLEPDSAALDNYGFADYFKVLGKAEVGSVTLNEVIKEISLGGIDWLKIDTQGTDLRIFKSLNDETREKVLALDVEPGLIDAYKGEDLFTATHEYLTKNGFWLSDMRIGKTVRIKRTSVNHMESPDKAVLNIQKNVKASPAWCEARYLRTLDRLSLNRPDKRSYILLWIFAMLDGQFGFAFDVVCEYGKFFGEDGEYMHMKKNVLSALNIGIGRRFLNMLRK
ncbi:MAG TPA: FkbM family methyltransferase [Candidatus Omnitrophota bacterium]|nr:FkbM family methyltransferase [Candidatus Omnitrophota bacterium]HPS19414.1 FkbM family methyltransferase [Candidatus Omnitrophota bacterium]